MAETRPILGLTSAEGSVLDALNMAMEQFDALPDQSAHERIEFYRGIHLAQAIVAVRVARRVNPEVWGR